MTISRDEFIIAHLPIAWAFKDPDARGAAILALVTKCNELFAHGAPTGHKNLSGLVKTVMHRAAVDVGREDIRERKRISRALHRGASSQRIAPFVQRRGGNITSTIRDFLARRESRTVEYLAAVDELAACCFDDVDRKIVDLKLLSYTNIEVARELKMTKQNVGYRVQAIVKCLQERESA